ncbi:MULTISPECIES: ABC transporter ATP-binding protein [unclassified Sphingopyxis]|jgi:iron(III) transport system ATP-binding protein|uniref:ABC transporter ATP-binding protein n=1 Tax=unclassified Sphingopyxis TaxID=2614943 RepID=UPI0026015D31|nr:MULTISPECIES: ABC transporter ATP-binding protein [unclassified Sphingopyxis]
MNKTAALTIENIGKRFGDVVAVTDACLTLEAGTVTCLLGPSGCGKTSLLRMIAGLERADTGQIHASGRMLAGDSHHVAPEDRGIGLVFQDYALFPHLDVAANIGFGLRTLDAASRAARVTALLDRFRIAPLASAYPHSLSGGEQQRVAIARALARDPAVVLMDEPFSGIEGALRREIQSAILAALRGSGAAVLIVTHDPEDAMRNGDRIVLMHRGRILQAGTPQTCYRAPTSLAAAAMLGPINAIPGVVNAGRLQSALTAYPAPDVADGPVLLLARPEDVTITPSDDDIAKAVTILGNAYIGGKYEVTMAIDDLTLVVHQPEPAIDGRYALAIDGGSVVPA